jgi:hypothetical protein
MNVTPAYEVERFRAIACRPDAWTGRLHPVIHLDGISNAEGYSCAAGEFRVGADSQP